MQAASSGATGGWAAGALEIWGLITFRLPKSMFNLWIESRIEIRRSILCVKIYLMNFFALIYFINKNMVAVEGDTPLSKDGASLAVGAASLAQALERPFQRRASHRIDFFGLIFEAAFDIFSPLLPFYARFSHLASRF